MSVTEQTVKLLDLTFQKCKSLEQQLKETQEKLKIAVDALKFYCDEKNWLDTHKSYKKEFRKIIKEDCTEVLRVGGETARQALKKIDSIN